MQPGLHNVWKNINTVADQRYHTTQYHLMPPMWHDDHRDIPLLARKM